jgi:hypothetical protein
MRIRRHRGSAISETGPALLILFLFVAFPLFDVLGITAQYCCAWYLNHLQMRAAVVNDRASGATAVDTVKNGFLASGPGAFLKSSATNITRSGPTYSAPPDLPGAATVNLETRVTCRPFLQIPFFGNVPGLGAPLTFRFNETRTREVMN